MEGIRFRYAILCGLPRIDFDVEGVYDSSDCSGPLLAW
jgi:hypothetical protein